MPHSIRCEEVIKLLLTYSCCYPILQYSGLYLSKPVAIIADDAYNQHSIAVALANNGCMYGLSYYKEVVENIQNSEIFPAVFIAPNSDSLGKRMKETFSLIQEVSRTDTLFDQRVCVPVFCIFDRHIPTELCNAFFCVYLHGKIDGWAQDIVSYKKMLISNGKNTSLGCENVKEIIQKRLDESPDFAVFATAIDIVGSIIPDFQTDNLISIAKTLCVWDEESEDIDDLMELFLNSMYQAARSGLIKMVYYLPNLEDSQLRDRDDALFINEKYIFLSEKMFTAIVKDMLSIFSIDVIKKSLRDEGIIISDSTTFTSKMSYITVFGVNQRMRMIRLDKDAVNIIGDIPFIELCRSKIGG